MRKTFEDTVAKLSVALELARRCVMSGEAEAVAEVRALADALKEATDEAEALADLDDLKLWINNETSAKSLKFLKNLHKRAKSKKTGTWKTRAYTARVLRYSGRFRTAWNRFVSATGEIANGNPALPLAEDKAEVFVDFAEFKAYLGYPRDANDLLDKYEIALPGVDPDPVAWHYWVRAFVFHQWGYVRDDADPTATPVPFDAPGDEPRYRQSNTNLGLARAVTKTSKALPADQVADTYLLEAANWGAIGRWREAHAGNVNEARTQAAAALAKFRKGPGNKKWSLWAEQRGRMPVNYFIPIDGRFPEHAVRAFRTGLRAHYLANLRWVGIEDNEWGEGENDLNDDHTGGGPDGDDA